MIYTYHIGLSWDAGSKKTFLIRQDIANFFVNNLIHRIMPGFGKLSGFVDKF